MKRRVLEAGDFVRYRRKLMKSGHLPTGLFKVAHVNPGERVSRVLLEHVPEEQTPSAWFSSSHLRPGRRKKPRYAFSNEVAMVETVCERVAKALMGEE